MKGDFSRLTFRPDKHYAAVLMQQGRASLDSDWNEQGVIMLEAVRAVARDLLGHHGGAGDAFRIRPHRGTDGRTVKWDVLIGAGSYYVDGIRCENRELVSYRTTEVELGCDEDQILQPGTYIAYLDVWDRVVTALEDPELYEQALGDQDTSVRVQVMWRVRLLALDTSTVDSPDEFLAETFARAGTTSMRARLDSRTGYTGLENRLYRVEIHAGGRSGLAAFKWSRDNGSVIAPVLEFGSDRLVIARASKSGFPPGTWVEPEDEVTARCGYASPLMRIESVEGDSLTTSPPWPLAHPGSASWIRRWDQGEAGDPGQSGAVALMEGLWIDLDDGIQIAFNEGGDYRPGDHWLIPARTAVHGIEWPADSGVPSSKPPTGVEHHRAPLAQLEIRRDGTVDVAKDLRRLIRPLGGSL